MVLLAFFDLGTPEVSGHIVGNDRVIPFGTIGPKDQTLASVQRELNRLSESDDVDQLFDNWLEKADGNGWCSSDDDDPYEDKNRIVKNVIRNVLRNALRNSGEVTFADPYIFLKEGPKRSETILRLTLTDKESAYQAVKEVFEGIGIPQTFIIR
jgi:hypothetical protein